VLKNSENLNEQESLNYMDTEVQKSKKFVFQVYSDNVEFIESLSYQEKNDLINKLLDDYNTSSVINHKFNKSVNITKKAVAIFFAVIIGIPLIIYLTAVSLNLTKSSYVKMQNNFENLF